MERNGRSFDDLAALYPDEGLAIASITASELIVGIYRARATKHRRRREEFIKGILAREEAVPILAFDLMVARRYAQLWAQLTTRGQLVGAHDMMIAATALAHNHTVLTHDLRDFGRVPGLAVHQPVW